MGKSKKCIIYAMESYLVVIEHTTKMEHFEEKVVI